MACTYNSTTCEEWRDVPGWEGVYEVSSLGRIRRGGRILTPNIKNGYPFVKLKNLPRKEGGYIHRLVCRAWHGEAASGLEVCHGDGDKTNNTPGNLRWATRRENMHDKIRHGAAAQRGRLASAKLAESDLPVIRQRVVAGERQIDIATDYGVSQSVISRIYTGHRKVQLCQ